MRLLLLEGLWKKDYNNEESNTKEIYKNLNIFIKHSKINLAQFAKTKNSLLNYIILKNSKNLDLKKNRHHKIFFRRNLLVFLKTSSFSLKSTAINKSRSLLMLRNICIA